MFVVKHVWTMYVCIYVYIDIHIYAGRNAWICRDVHMYVYRQICMNYTCKYVYMHHIYLCMQVHMNPGMNPCVCVCVCVKENMHKSLYAHMDLSMYVGVHAWWCIMGLCIYVYVCMHVYRQAWVYTCIYTFMLTYIHESLCMYGCI